MEKQVIVPTSFTVDKFLVYQEQFLATIEPVTESANLLKITPWLGTSGCQCEIAFKLPKEAIKSVTPIGIVKPCCGHILQVVSIEFNTGATVPIENVVRFLKEQAANSIKSQIAAKNLGIVCPNGWMNCNGVCFDPNTHHCDKGIVCPNGWMNCNGVCFDPGTHHCDKGIVCPNGWMNCNGVCFDPGTHHCDNGKLSVRTAG